ncbi:DoxX family protein [Spirosoma jeollabukense]
MELKIKELDVIHPAYGLSENKRSPANRAQQTAYWIVTVLISFELIYGALWDFNLLNKGYVDGVLGHLGYPLYLGPILGACKLIAVVVVLLPGFRLLKEWAYAGLAILFSGAFVSHVVVGDNLGQFVWPLLFGLLVIGSWALRPANRRHD